MSTPEAIYMCWESSPACVLDLQGYGRRAEDETLVDTKVPYKLLFRFKGVSGPTTSYKTNFR